MASLFARAWAETPLPMDEGALDVPGGCGKAMVEKEKMGRSAVGGVRRASLPKASRGVND